MCTLPEQLQVGPRHVFSFLDNHPTMCLLPQTHWNLCEKITVTIATKKLLIKVENLEVIKTLTLQVPPSEIKSTIIHLQVNQYIRYNIQEVLW